MTVAYLRIFEPRQSIGAGELVFDAIAMGLLPRTLPDCLGKRTWAMVLANATSLHVEVGLGFFVSISRSQASTCF